MHHFIFILILILFFECGMSQSKMTSQSIALREAIKEYEANKWKVIGQKVGKPAKVGNTFFIFLFFFFFFS
jgi:hypothetical protein